MKSEDVKTNNIYPCATKLFNQCFTEKIAFYFSIMLKLLNVQPQPVLSKQ